MQRMELVGAIRHKVVIEGHRQHPEVSEPKRLDLNLWSRPVLEGVKPRMDQLLVEWAGRITVNLVCLRGG